MSTTTSDEEGAPPQAPAGANPPEDPFPMDKVVKRQLAFESKEGEEKGDSGAISAAETTKPRVSAAVRRESAETERFERSITSRGNHLEAMRITVS